MMKLSERIIDFRCDRLSEWGMDDLAFDAKKLEKENEKLKERIAELEMVESKFSAVINKAWRVIKRATFENFDLELRNFMEGE